jgi:hypothetical protein
MGRDAALQRARLRMQHATACPADGRDRGARDTSAAARHGTG